MQLCKPPPTFLLRHAKKLQRLFIRACSYNTSALADEKGKESLVKYPHNLYLIAGAEMSTVTFL